MVYYKYFLSFMYDAKFLEPRVSPHVRPTRRTIFPTTGYQRETTHFKTELKDVVSLGETLTESDLTETLRQTKASNT